ncbi:DNA polymerase I, thermostable [compost metagenome]
MSKQQANRREIAKVLAYAPVPVTVCKVLDEQFPGQRSKKSWDLAFWAFSHLLANAGQNFISQSGFEVLGASTDHSRQSLDVQRLKDAGVIEEVHEAVWDVAGRTARVFQIPDALLSLMVESQDFRTCQAPSQYRSRNYFKASPFVDLNESVRVRNEEEEGLVDAILELQSRPLGFDQMGLIQDLRADWGDLPPNARRKRLSVAASLADGDNFTRYRLAKTGRVQASQPNFQGIPKAIRRWFYPPKGLLWMDYDYKTAESWIVAHLSGDHALMKALEGDVYRMIAAEFDLDRNSQVKPMVNAYNYSAGVLTLARILEGKDEMEWPTPEGLKLAQEFVRFMRTSFPTASAWLKEKAAEVRVAGRAVSLGGYVSPPISTGKAQTRGVNHIVQGTGADILRAILIRLHHELHAEQGFVQIPMHDGLLVSYTPANRAAVDEIVMAAMRESVGKFLPGLAIPVDTAEGWCDKGERAVLINVRPKRHGGGEHAGTAA